MNTPAKHFRPQSAQQRRAVLKQIDAVEIISLPPGFKAEMVEMDGLHLQSIATPLAHEPGSVDRLQQQLRQAETQRRMRALAQLPLAPLNQQHIAVIKQHQASRKNANNSDIAATATAEINAIYAHYANQSKAPRWSQFPQQQQQAQPPIAQDPLNDRIRAHIEASSASDRKAAWFIGAVMGACIAAVVFIPYFAKSA